MKCKHCQAELDEGITLCPECGTENAEAVETPVEVVEAPAEAVEAPVEAVEAPAEAAETPVKAEPEMKQGLSAGKITLLVVLGIVAIGIVIAMIIGGLSGNETGKPTDPTDVTNPVASADPSEPTGETAEPTIPADGNPDDVTCKGSYTVSDDEMTAAADTVVATMGEAKLTNAELQIYYWMQVYDFLNYYASYASMMGLDYTQSLDTQLSMDGVQTWQQYFLDSALNTWKNYQAMALEADANSFELEAEYADYLDGLAAELETTAQSAGFENAEAMLQADMGVGATLKAYEAYMHTYYRGVLYYGAEVEKITLTDSEVEAFFDENAETYLEKGLEKNDDRYVDVRHILLQPTGGTEGEDGTTTFSDAEWAACKKEAEEVLNQWLSGDKTEEAFAALAEQHSTDGGSNTNGGLYENVYVGQMVEPFENWCFDETRKYGDYGIVQTTYGYHVMFFVESSPIWYETAWNDLMTQRSNELLENTMEAYPTTVDYSAIVLGNVNLAAVS